MCSLLIIGVVVGRVIVLQRREAINKQTEAINNSPVVSICATIVAKRTNTEGATFGMPSMGTDFHPGVYGYTDTSCHATFELNNGYRMEFNLNPKMYGLLAERDTGILTYQSTKFLDFERENVLLRLDDDIYC